MSNDTPYKTRYGAMTANEAALDLLDRARFRTLFLGTMFQSLLDAGVTIPSYEVGGLASILQDIGHDIAEAYNYYYGDNDMPGKIWR